MRLGHIDRQLTMLHHSGRLHGVRAIAVGQYTDCDASRGDQGDWTALDVLRDRLALLGCRSSAACRSATEGAPSPYRWEPQRRSTRTPARCE
jgi:hypothetical protein